MRELNLDKLHSPMPYTFYKNEGTDAIFLIHQSEMFQEAPDVMIYGGKNYLRGPLEVVPNHLNYYPGMRRYYLGAMQSTLDNTLRTR